VARASAAWKSRASTAFTAQADHRFLAVADAGRGKRGPFPPSFRTRMNPPTFAFPYSAAILTGICFAAACSSADDARRGTNFEKGDGGAAEAYRVVATSDSLVLRRVGRIVLGIAPQQTPAQAGRVVVAGDRVLVADKARRRLLAFDRSGALLAELPFGKGPLAGAKNPVAFAVARDTAFVLDLSAAGIIALNIPSQTATNLSMRRRSSAIDLARLKNGALAVAEVGLDPEVVDGKATIIRLLAQDATHELRVCRPHSIYAASIRRGGIISMFREFGVTADEEHVFCRQPVTPVVQFFEANGAPAGAISFAPPFYQPPPGDISATTNVREIGRFTSTWTEHARFFPHGKGFLSVYRRHDLDRGVPIHSLFACDAVSVPVRCRVGSLTGEPFQLTGDTLFVLDPVGQPGVPRSITILVVQ